MTLCWSILLKRLSITLVALALGEAHSATFTVTTSNDSGSGSLRQTILDANASSGLDTITFKIPGSGVRTISPATALPPILDPVIIDGTTQPGYVNRPLIELNGANAGNNSGLRLLSGNSTVRGLTINRCGASGITIQGPGTNVIVGNYIGTDPAGTSARANAQEGVLIQTSFGNVVGGTNESDRNLLSGNSDSGVYIINGGSNIVKANYVGTRADGRQALGNANVGVVIYHSRQNIVGGNSPAERNVVSGNQGSGVYLFGAASTGNLILGNYIGADVNGANPVGNRGDGITLAGAPGNEIGGSRPGDGNVISANAQAGVFLDGTGAAKNTLAGNLIGTDARGLAALGNGFAGITLLGAISNRIGSPVSPTGRNVISGNKQDGVFISTNSARNLLQANLIGVDVTGNKALSNGFNGISISAASSNQIGGASAEFANVISGNAFHGLQANKDAAWNLAQGNLIGTAAGGLTAMPNGGCGCRIESPWNMLGGGLAGAGNVISGNTLDGVLLVGTTAFGNVIQGNLIGTDLRGVTPVANRRAGVGLSGAGTNQVGGVLASEGNLVSGNGDAGIYVMGNGASGNRIAGNRIGTDSTGVTPLKNRYEGIYIERGQSNTIGGASADLGNLISGNGTRGIYLTNSSHNIIQGNSIGTAPDGTTALPNGVHGIECEVGANDNLIGGANGSGNRIAFAAAIYSGVRVRDESRRNSILSNQIFSNGGLGIDLSDYSVTANDHCDVDDGANSLQNFPQLTAAVSSAGQLRITGKLDSSAGQSFLLQFYLSPATSPSGYGQGRFFIGQTNVTTEPDCQATFSISLDANAAPGSYVTATATDALGDTSEFSQAVQVLSTPALTVLATEADRLTFCWDSALTGAILVQTDSLVPPVAWVPVQGVPQVVDGRNVLSIQRAGNHHFFTLRFQ